MVVVDRVVREEVSKEVLAGPNLTLPGPCLRLPGPYPNARRGVEGGTSRTQFEIARTLREIALTLFEIARTLREIALTLFEIARTLREIARTLFEIVQALCEIARTPFEMGRVVREEGSKEALALHLKPPPYTLHPTHYTLNPEIYNLNNQPPTLNQVLAFKVAMDSSVIRRISVHTLISKPKTQNHEP